MYKDKQRDISKYRKTLLDNQTNSELIFASILKKYYLKYIPQKGFISGKGKYIVDFYLPKPYKVCIEIDGASHRGREEYDRRRTAYLSSDRRFRVIRFTNEEVKDEEYVVSVLKNNGIIDGSHK